MEQYNPLLEEYLKDDCDYYRHRTVDSKLNAILSSGVRVKGGEDSTYTVEHAKTPQELLTSHGYFEAAAKGEGKTVDLYFQIPSSLSNIPNFNFDKLRMEKEDYIEFVEKILYPSVLSDKDYEECKTLLNIVDRDPIFLESYYEKKEKLPFYSALALSALEPMFIKKKKNNTEELNTNSSSSFTPEEMLPVVEKDPTIIPVAFVKYIVEDDRINENPLYFEELGEDTQRLIIEFIESRCKKDELSF